MSDAQNLQLFFGSYRKQVLALTKSEQGDSGVDLIAHMSFGAGAQAVMACLEADRSHERFIRMVHEVQMMRMDVHRRLTSKGLLE